MAATRLRAGTGIAECLSAGGERPGTGSGRSGADDAIHGAPPGACSPATSGRVLIWIFD